MVKSSVPLTLEQLAPEVSEIAPAHWSLAGGCCMHILKFQSLVDEAVGFVVTYTRT